MSVPLAVPVMMVCLTVTTPSVDDGAYSTVAKMEIVACTPCNSGVKPCALPPDFEALARELNAPREAEGKKKPKVRQ